MKTRKEAARELWAMEIMNQNYKLTLYAVQVYGVSRDPLKYYATAKKNEMQFGKGQKMVTFMTNLIATISVKKRRAAR